MHRGEVWQLALDRESSPGEATLRVVLILSSDALAVLPLRVVVPLVPWQEDFTSAPWMVRVPPVLRSGLSIVMAADALQVRSVSSARLTAKLGDLPTRLVDVVAAAVGLVLNAPGEPQV